MAVVILNKYITEYIVMAKLYILMSVMHHIGTSNHIGSPQIFLHHVIILVHKQTHINIMKKMHKEYKIKYMYVELCYNI